MLSCRNGRHDTLAIVGARVVDPGQGVDEALDVTIENGVITALEPTSAAARGLVLAPAFVDPHVHLRTPGHEDEESIESGTAAAAAGGYCAILAMPNTEPVVDSAAVLGAQQVVGVLRPPEEPSREHVHGAPGGDPDEAVRAGQMGDVGVAGEGPAVTPRAAGVVEALGLENDPVGAASESEALQRRAGFRFGHPIERSAVLRAVSRAREAAASGRPG